MTRDAHLQRRQFTNLLFPFHICSNSNKHNFLFKQKIQIYFTAYEINSVCVCMCDSIRLVPKSNQLIFINFISTFICCCIKKNVDKHKEGSFRKDDGGARLRTNESIQLKNEYRSNQSRLESVPGATVFLAVHAEEVIEKDTHLNPHPVDQD